MNGMGVVLLVSGHVEQMVKHAVVNKALFFRS